MISLRPHRSPTSRAQFASAGENWEESLEAEKDEAKERLKSLRYEKYIAHLRSGTRANLIIQSYRKAQRGRVGRGTGTTSVRLLSLERDCRSQGRKNPYR